MVALDTSVLAFAVNRYAPEHARAARVVEELLNGDRPWALPWPVAYEFAEFVTHPHAVARALKASEAWGFLEQILGSPAVHVLGPTERHAGVLAEVLRGLAHRASLPSGLEIAVLLREHGVREILSCDRGMRSFGFLAVHDPLHGDAWTPDSAPARRYRVLKSRHPGRA